MTWQNTEEEELEWETLANRGRGTDLFSSKMAQRRSMPTKTDFGTRGDWSHHSATPNSAALSLVSVYLYDKLCLIAVLNKLCLISLQRLILACEGMC